MNIQTIFLTNAGGHQHRSRHFRLLLLRSVFTVIVLSFSNCKDDPSPAGQPLPQQPALHLTRISSGEKSYESFAYNPDGSLASSEIRWFYSDSSATHSQVNIAYDSRKLPAKILINGQLAVAFFYNGNVLEKTEEYDHRNRIAVTHFYTFNPKGLLTTLLDHVHSEDGPASDYHTRFLYTYDEIGNVKEVNSFRQLTQDAAFTPLEQVIYQDYDDKQNPMQPQLSYPFLPVKCTQQNNPGKITIRLAKNQSVISSQSNTYTYNNQGYPTSVLRQLTTMKPLPPTQLLFSYQ